MAKTKTTAIRNAGARLVRMVPLETPWLRSGFNGEIVSEKYSRSDRLSGRTGYLTTPAGAGTAVAGRAGLAATTPGSL